MIVVGILRRMTFIRAPDKILCHNKDKRLPRYVFPSTYYFVTRCYDRAEWNRRKPSLEIRGGARPSFAALYVSPKKRKGALEALVEENSFPRQRSYEQVTAKFAEWRAECRREKEGCKENKLLQLPAATCSIGEYEFNRRWPWISQKQKPTSKLER